jgi:hypothetical protein
MSIVMFDIIFFLKKKGTAMSKHVQVNKENSIRKKKKKEGHNDNDTDKISGPSKHDFGIFDKLL